MCYHVCLIQQDLLPREASSPMPGHTGHALHLCYGRFEWLINKIAWVPWLAIEVAWMCLLIIHSSLGVWGAILDDASWSSEWQKIYLLQQSPVDTWSGYGPVDKEGERGEKKTKVKTTSAWPWNLSMSGYMWDDLMHDSCMPAACKDATRTNLVELAFVERSNCVGQRNLSAVYASTC